jgi:hypothetical protein
MRSLVVSILVASLLGATTMGCNKDKDKDEPKRAAAAAPAPQPAKAPAPARTAAAASPVLGDKIEIPTAHAQFNAPGGWKKTTAANGWVLFKAPDNHARLGYVAFEQPGEATSRLGQLAEAFDLTNLVWGSATDGAVGKDHFPDHEGTTRSCTLKNGDPCDMRYMTINPGGPVQMMVVYLVNTTHGEALRSHATASVDSIRRM